MKKKNAENSDPFAPETIKLRRPLPGGKGGEEIAELILRPAEVRDARAADARRPGTMGHALAMLASLTGAREASLARLIPEDWADVAVSLNRINLRFAGETSLVDPPEGDGEAGPFDPFAPEIVRLRRPLRSGDAEVREISLRPPEARDILRTDDRPEGTFGYAVALLSSLSGLPETLLDRMIPEDWAAAAGSLERTHLRFAGAINAVDGKGVGGEDPPAAEADTPPPTSATT